MSLPQVRLSTDFHAPGALSCPVGCTFPGHRVFVSPHAHSEYPHEEGYLYGCAACEDGPCMCDLSDPAGCASVDCAADLNHDPRNQP